MIAVIRVWGEALLSCRGPYRPNVPNLGGALSENRWMIPGIGRQNCNFSKAPAISVLSELQAWMQFPYRELQTADKKNLKSTALEILAFCLIKRGGFHIKHKSRWSFMGGLFGIADEHRHRGGLITCSHRQQRVIAPTLNLPPLQPNDSSSAPNAIPSRLIA